jgi:hypothetical protein
VGKSWYNPNIPPLGGQPKEACVMMRRLSKWAGVLLAMSLVLGLPFVASVQTAGAGQFTVEFNADGSINRVFSAGITSLAGKEPVQPDPNNVDGLRSRLHGKTVNNVTSVTIVTTEDDDPCINQGGKYYCW